MSEIHSEAVVVDSHNDLLLLVARARQFDRPGTLTTKWLPILRKGGIDVQVLPIHIDEEYIPEGALRRTLLLIEYLHREVEASDGAFALCRTGAEIDEAVGGGKIALVLALEGSQGVGTNVELFESFFRLGVRMASFSWFGRTFLADGGGEKGGGGRLTGLGVAALAELERLGIVMDVSHLSAEGTAHVLELATRPVVASHSSARALLDHHRNLTDTEIKGIAATGGVVGINLFPGFIDPQNATVDRVVDHIEHAASTGGIDHVGIGADFVGEIFEVMAPDQPDDYRVEGIDPRMPIEGLESPADMPVLTDKLIERGFREDDIVKILGGNFLRVFREVMGIAGPAPSPDGAGRAARPAAPG
jgi:membrane dipeptidase